jgi:hypothetical protein
MVASAIVARTLGDAEIHRLRAVRFFNVPPRFAAIRDSARMHLRHAFFRLASCSSCRTDRSSAWICIFCQGLCKIRLSDALFWVFVPGIWSWHDQLEVTIGGLIDLER